MKFAILAPLLLSSTAFARAGRWKRQDPSPTTAAPSATTSSSFTICRDARDCLSGERCMFVTHNGLNNGYNGACVAENYSYVPPPQPTTALGPCVFQSDCRNDEFCSNGIYDANGVAQDGHCTSNQPGGPCSFNYNCQATQYCNTGKCTDYQDCRGQFCSPPVGETAFCRAEQANATDLRDPDSVFVCIYPSGSSSSVASSITYASSVAGPPANSISSTASSTVSTTAASTLSTTPAPVLVASSPGPIPAVLSSSAAAVAPAQSDAASASAPEPTQPSPSEAEDSNDHSAWRDEYRDQENARKYPINRRSKNLSA